MNTRCKRLLGVDIRNKRHAICLDNQNFRCGLFAFWSAKDATFPSMHPSGEGFIAGNPEVARLPRRGPRREEVSRSAAPLPLIGRCNRDKLLKDEMAPRRHPSAGRRRRRPRGWVAPLSHLISHRRRLGYRTPEPQNPVLP